MKLSVEPVDNRVAHMLHDDVLLQHYANAIAVDAKRARVSYRAFCEQRRKLITRGLLTWAQGAGDADKQQAADAIVPTARLLEPRPEGIIRRFGLPGTVETSLILLAGEKLAKTAEDSDRMSIFCRRKKANGGIEQVCRIDISGTPLSSD